MSAARVVPSTRPRRPLANLRGVTANAGVTKPTNKGTSLRPGQRPGSTSTAPASGGRRCPQCDSTDVQEDEGFLVCQSCFSQIGEANIVADVTFEEQAGGRSTVQGGFVSDNARHAKTLGSGAYRKVGGGERNSLAEIETNGRRALANLTPKLGVADNVAQQANAIWSLAAGINFSAGRKTDEVVAACLYAACRRQTQNEILLMDISELLQINVFRLGEVYKDLCKELYLSNESVGIQHLVELEPLIWKYCRKLQFEDKTKDVATDALKIMKRMTRDWIVAGRHPAGLCGACIILAARMNNFRRSVREVVYVSKVADVTIAKRVEEFRRTKSAALTVDQFREFGVRLKHQHDPPSFGANYHARMMEKRKKKRAEHMLRMSGTPGGTPQVTIPPSSRIEMLLDDNDDADDVSSRASSEDRAPAVPTNADGAEPEQSAEPFNAPLPTPAATQESQPSVSQTASAEAGPSSRRPGGAKRKHSSNGSDSTDPPTPYSPNTSGVSNEETGSKRRRVQAGSSIRVVSTPGEPEVRYDADGFVIPPLPIDPALLPPEVNAIQRPRKKNDPPPTIDLTKEELLSEKELELEIESALDNDEVIDSRNEVEKAKDDERAHLLAVQQKQVEAELAEARRKADGVQFGKAPEWNPGDVLDENDLAKEFENDPEVQNCRLSPAETRVKERIWVAHNEDWLRKQVEKEILNLARANQPPSQKKGGRKGGGEKARKRRSKMGDGSVLTEHSTPIETPADAAKAMLQKRAPQKSMHVDFSALERIYGRQPLSRRGSESASASVAASREQTPASSTAPDRAEEESTGDGAGAADKEGGAAADAVGGAESGKDNNSDNDDDNDDENNDNNDDVDTASTRANPNFKLPGWEDIDEEPQNDEDDGAEEDYRYAMAHGDPGEDEFGMMDTSYGDDDEGEEYE